MTLKNKKNHRQSHFMSFSNDQFSVTGDQNKLFNFWKTSRREKTEYGYLMGKICTVISRKMCSASYENHQQFDFWQFRLFINQLQAKNLDLFAEHWSMRIILTIVKVIEQMKTVFFEQVSVRLSRKNHQIGVFYL